jgi:phospholipid/cholesterol/gamma-HCH transport system permease protein
MADQNSFISYDTKTRHLYCRGDWVVDNLPKLGKELFNLPSLPSSGEIIIDGEKLTKLDSSGAWVLNSLEKKLEEKRLTVSFNNFSEERLELVNLISKQLTKKIDVPTLKPMPWVARVGKATVAYVNEAYEYLSFTGYLTLEALKLLKHPSHIRFRDFVNVVERAGYDALPIIALISFMVGIVLTHQMGLQLKNYGANAYIVDFLGYAALREFGPLITAIMVAGRTGSAFTAQLGTMKINQEIDALDTMGLTAAEVLILPRLTGLLLALPLLTMWADIFCIIGGMVISKSLLGIASGEFLMRFQHQIPMSYLLIGLAKAPIFALIIGSIGCFQGTKVEGSSDSVGKQTTRSVVMAIFFIIVADALFSIILTAFNF